MKTHSEIPSHQDRAKVPLFPPIVGLIVALLGIALHLFYPLNIFSSGWLTLGIGVLVLGAGIGLQVMCIRVMKKAKTTPLFKKPTTQIIKSGPFGRSRNPIYIAVLLQFTGLAIVVNSVWLVLSLLIIFLYLHFGVIPGEETYLTQKFGKEFQDYKSRVPKWL